MGCFNFLPQTLVMVTFWKIKMLPDVPINYNHCEAFRRGTVKVSTFSIPAEVLPYYL